MCVFCNKERASLIPVNQYSAIGSRQTDNGSELGSLSYNVKFPSTSNFVTVEESSISLHSWLQSMILFHLILKPVYSPVSMPLYLKTHRIKNQ